MIKHKYDFYFYYKKSNQIQIIFELYNQLNHSQNIYFQAQQLVFERVIHNCQMKYQPQSQPQIEGDEEVIVPSKLPTISINIKVIVEQQNGKQTHQMVEDFRLNECLDDAIGCNIVLKRVLLNMKNEMNFCLQNRQIYFYLDKCGIFMNCGIDPINQDVKIRPSDYRNRKQIVIKAKDLGISMVHRLMTFQNTVGANSQQKEKGGIDQMAQRSKCRRTKERRIGHIIDKVIQWRKFYSGALNDKNQVTKFSLQDAAKEVKISKKSLDDYLFQIRFGHKFGFNFNEHYNDKVGVLRDFVRQRKKNDKYDTKSRKVNGKNGQNDY